MSTVDPLKAALALTRGAEFHRCALQVNPHGYAAKYRGTPNDGDALSYARAIVAKAVDLGISVLAITDHNSAEGVDAFRIAARELVQPIHIFPGFELRSKEGVHVLCIYPPATDEVQLGRFLGEFGIRDAEPAKETLANKSFEQILPCVREQGGITIAAHVTNDNGLFKVMQGQPLIHVWQSPELLAVQIPGGIDALDLNHRRFVQNGDPSYRRATAGEADGLAVAVVNARDVCTPEQLEAPAASCFIKMSEVSIEGLRQAFLDPESRIRLGTEPENHHGELLAIAWEGRFLEKVQIHFNPNLNVLIGGRGTGKSTILESIRYAMALEPVGDDARAAHQGVVKHVLQPGTKISLLVRRTGPDRREYRIERTIPNPPTVRDDHGELSNLTPRDLLPQLEVYGQHEIAELSKSREKLTKLLERFAERDEDLTRRKHALRRDLEKSRRAVLDVRAELRAIDERLAALPGLEETLARFRELGIEERLRDRSLLVREEHVLAAIPERLEPHRASAEALAQPLDLQFLSPKALEELPARPLLERAREVLVTLEGDLATVAAQLDAALARASEGVAAITSEWSERKQAVQLAYEKILRELQKVRVDGAEFIRLRQQIEELRPLRERHVLLQREDKERSDRRRALLAEWDELKGAEFRRLDKAASRVTKKLKAVVAVKVTFNGKRDALAELLREEVGGPIGKAIAALEDRESLSLAHFVESCRAGAATLAKQFLLPLAAAERLAKADPEVLMRIEELELAHPTDITLNTAPPGEPPVWQSLEELSAGQKATAVLLLLLLDSEAPLLVDQPEDDLDNRFITESVVPRMREAKQRRQFIVSTHNANIPVLADAELIVGLDASGEPDDERARAAARVLGALDSAPVREMVEEILEGGPQAFERRRRKYGLR